MPDFANGSVSKSRTRAVYRPSTDAWHTRRVCTTLPIVVVETLDAIAEASGRSRSLVITDALLAYPAIAAALTPRGDR